LDHKLIELFEEELTHVRRMADEFKHAHPQVAERLLLGQDPPDPYVQQLLDGFAYLAARIHLKLDAEFPRFTEALLGTIFPHYLAPTPAMAVVELEPDWSNGELASSPVVPKGTRLESILQPGDSVRCVFTTAHDLQLSPIRLVESRYFGRDLAEIDNGWAKETDARAAIRIRLKATAGLKFNQIETNKIVLHIRPHENLAGIIYEELLAHTQAVVVQSASKPLKVYSVLQPPPVRAMGFEDNEALLPSGARTFSGYRVLQEYFAFPERFFFVEVGNMRQAFAQAATDEIDLIFCLKNQEPRLERRIEADCFSLYCTPAINLFTQDNIVVDLKDEREEHVLVPDRTKTLEYEVYSVERVMGRPKGSNRPDEKYEFQSFYFSTYQEAGAAGFFSTRRVPRQLTDLENRHSPVSEYLGSEVYLSLAGEGVQATLKKLNALHVRALCSNRHVPMSRGEIQFDPGIGPPVAAIKTISKTAPRNAHINGRDAWRVISHLSLNYRSLLSGDNESGAATLQEMLRLYVADDRDIATAQIRALKQARAHPSFRRVGSAGPIAYARGLNINLEFDETPFSGCGVFLFASVLNRFFSRFVTLNSFVQTELQTQQRGRVYQWPASKGMKQML
jgi:type VI secretion system protein ImpG